MSFVYKNSDTQNSQKSEKPSANYIVPYFSSGSLFTNLLRMQRPVLENSFENISGNNIGKDTTTENMTTDIIQINKQQYIETVVEQRRNTVHQHFSREIAQLFNDIREGANRMKDCRYQLSIELEESMNGDWAEKILQDYFEDLGYITTCGARKGDVSRIVLTIM